MDEENYFRLPPDVKIKAVTKALSEVVDWSLNYMHIPELWKQTKGKGVHVAVLDTGFSPHPDLDDAMVETVDFTHSPSGARDVVGHSMWCLGMIGGRANGIGVIGVMPECRMSAYKVLGDGGSGDENSIGAAMERVLQTDVDICSLSLGGGQMSDGLRKLFQRFTSKRGKFLFGAAGNDGNLLDVNYPAKWPEFLCIGAIGKDGRPTRFSNGGPRVDAYAPGLEMVSTIPMERGGYGTMSGTSMACPQAAAIGGLALAKHREFQGATELATTEQMREHIKRTAKMENGIGIINPVALLDEIKSEQPPADREPLVNLPFVKVFAPAAAGDHLGVLFGNDSSKLKALAVLKALEASQN